MTIPAEIPYDYQEEKIVILMMGDKSSYNKVAYVELINK